MADAATKELVRVWLEDSKRHYLSDLESLSDAQLREPIGGECRTPYDFTYEASTVCRRWISRIEGEPLGETSAGPGTRAPEEFQNRQVAEQAFASAMDALIATWDALPEGELLRPIETPGGPTSPLDLAILAVYHAGYHNGQLCFIQSHGGDKEVHW